MPGPTSWLDKYLAATPADGAAVAPKTTDPRGPSTGSVWKDAVGGYGQFSPSARGDATLGLVNQLVNPLRQADQVGEDAGSGHPIRAAVGAAGLAAPLAMHYAAGPLAELLAKIAPKGYEAGEVAAHAPASPGYNGGRGLPPAPAPDAPVPPQNLGIGGGGQPGDFIQGAQMNMAPGAADAQMLQNARRANVGDPAPVAPRPLPTAPTNTVSGRMDGLDPSLYTRKTMSDATAVAKPSLPPLNAAEQRYAEHLRSTGVKDPEWTAYRDLRLRGNDPPSYGTMADSLMSGAAQHLDQNRQAIAAVVGDGRKPTPFVNEKGYQKVLHWSTREPGKIQVTTMDAAGPARHDTYKNVATAIHNLASDGYAPQ